MKPIYQGCMERGIQHVAEHAADAALGTSISSSRRTGTKSPTINGKVKRS